MIKSVTVTSEWGDSVKMGIGEPDQSGLLIADIDGIGPGNATVNVSEMYSIDGALFASSRLPSRTITIRIIFNPKDANTSIEDLRQSSYLYFPIKRRVTLSFETDNRTLLIDGYIEANEPTVFEEQEETSISIICPNPYFKSPSNDETLFFGTEGLFEFPFSNESLTEDLLEMSQIVERKTNTIIYTGDNEVGMKMFIKANGPASGLTVWDLDTRQFFRIKPERFANFLAANGLYGSTIQKGDEIIIDTIKGEKSIVLFRDGRYWDILDTIDFNSTWFQLKKGKNELGYTADVGSDNLYFRIESYVLYEGI